MGGSGPWPAKAGPILSCTFLVLTGQPFLCPIVLPGGQYVLASMNKDLKTAGPLPPALGRKSRSTGREGASLTSLCPGSAEGVGGCGRGALVGAVLALS